MAYDYPEIRAFSGLFKQANSFNVPDGALEEAKNIVLTNDNRLAKRRGFYQYYDPSPDTLRSLFTYQDRLVAVYSDKSGYLTEGGTAPNETATATFHAFPVGADITVTAPRRVEFVKANKNLYFTTDQAVAKLDAFDGRRLFSGVAAGTDIEASFVAENGIQNNDSAIGYRVLFGRRDANDNLLLGAPSDQIIIQNAVLTGGYTLSANTVSVNAVDHNYSVGMVVTISNAAGSTPVPDGLYTITAVPSKDFFEFSFVGSDQVTVANIDHVSTRKPRLEFSLPRDVQETADGWFYQVYRTSQSADATTVPSADYKLVVEEPVTATDALNNFVIFDDFVADIFLGAELYTNPNSREGELQANARAPFAETIAGYKGHLLYGNVKTRAFFNLDVIDPLDIAVGQSVIITSGATTLNFEARVGTANETVIPATIAGSGTPTLTFTFDEPHGLFNGDTVNISRISGTLVAGEYVTTFISATSYSVPNPGSFTLTDCSIQGLETSGGNPMFLTFQTGGLAENIRRTAKSLVKAINRSVNVRFYANYISTFTGTPGKMRISGIQPGDPILVSTSAAITGEAFSPLLTTTPTDNQSEQDELPNSFYSSKIDEPEAVPIVNFFPVGSGDDKIIAIRALRDSAIILKEDGVYKLNGDTVAGFTITILDSTVKAINPGLVDVINNQVIFLSNQGVCLVTENSVQIISRRIEDVIQPIVGLDTTKIDGGAVAYESERLWFMTCALPGGSTPETTYAFNILNQTWTEWPDILFSAGALGPNNKLHLVSQSGELLRERKNQTRIDYCGRNYSSTINTVTADSLGGNVTIIDTTPEIGDVFVKDDVFTRIQSVADLGSNVYDLQFTLPTNLVAAETPDFYSGYDSEIKLAPFHAGRAGLSKQFAQMSLVLRQGLASQFFLTYQNSYTESALELIWDTINLPRSDAQGWGNQPWGLFGWGNVNGIELRYGTFPAAIIRTYIPRFAQRDIYIQPIIKHVQAGEPIELQALTFSVRAIRERISR